MAGGFDARCQPPAPGLAPETGHPGLPGPASGLRASRLGARGALRLADGRLQYGVNLVTRDPLALAQHPAVQEAAHAAIAEFGLVAGGSAACAGMTPPVQALETRLAALLGMRSATVFAQADQAAGDALRLLLRPGDHAVLAAGLPCALAVAAQACGATLHRIAADPGALAQRLEMLRELHPRAEILVAVPALDGATAVAADLPAFAALARAAGAWLLVDVSHDLGLAGPGGRGIAALWPIDGQIDLMTGDLSGVFAGEGGFVAARHPGVQPALRAMAEGQVQRAALSPVQAAAIHAALTLATGPEGEAARARLRARRLALQIALRDEGFAPEPRGLAALAVPLGDPAFAAALTAALHDAGAFVALNLLGGRDDDDPPRAEWLLQATAAHSLADIDEFLTALQRARASGPPQG